MTKTFKWKKLSSSAKAAMKLDPLSVVTLLFPFRSFGHSLDLTINKGLKLTRMETAVRKCQGVV